MMTGGLKKPIRLVHEDKTELLQSDISGYHKVYVVRICCEQLQCHNKQYDVM